ncbi:MAG: hypothetical protein Kow0059_12660 [Candidatus Sumerlaeia bacterium]
MRKRFAVRFAGAVRWAAALVVAGAVVAGGLAPAQSFIVRVPRDYTDINAAIAAAGPNGQVVISPGIYDRTSQSFPIVVPFNLILRGSGTYETIIDGTGVNGPLIRVEGMNSTFFGLFDFTVRHGNNASGDGGGLSIRNSPALTIQGVRVFRNQALNRGGGMMIENASPTLVNVEFRDNRAQNGGALGITGAASSPVIRACRFSGNQAGVNGGAAALGGDATALFTGSRFEDNRADGLGGALYAVSTSGLILASGPMLSQCTLQGNQAAGGAAVAVENYRLTLSECEVLEQGGGQWAVGYCPAGARLDLDRCLIGRNTSQNHLVLFEGEGDVTNSTFYRNQTINGSIVRVQGAGAGVRAVHNTFAHNLVGGGLSTGVVSQDRGALLFQNNIVAFHDAIGFVESGFSSDPVFRYNLMYENTLGNYLDEGFIIIFSQLSFSMVLNPVPAVGVLVQNPRFRDAGVNNFRLGAGSPALNAGQTVAGVGALDIDGEDRTAPPAGARPDMGSDEQLAPYLTLSAFWFDKSFDGVASEGDELVLQFNEPVALAGPLLASDFVLPVSGDSLGTSFTATVNAENPTQLIITLGAAPRLTEPGAFDSGTLAPGSPSGIELTGSPRPGVLTSVRTGLDAQRFLAGGARDVVVPMRPNSAALVYDSVFPQSLTAGAGGYFTKNRLDFPPGSPLSSVVLLMAPRFEFAGALSAMQISEVSGVTVIDPERPVKITMEYTPLELNGEGPEFEKRLRIFVRRQSLTGAYQFLPVEDAYGGVQQVDTQNHTISVFTTELIPQDINFATIENGGGDGPGDDEAAVTDGGGAEIQRNTLAVYLVAPLDVMTGASQTIIPAVAAPGAGRVKPPAAPMDTAGNPDGDGEEGRGDEDGNADGAAPGLSSVTVEPSRPLQLLDEVYYFHRLDLPNFDPDDDSVRGVTLQTAADRFEREEFVRSGLPEGDFSVTEILTWEGDPGNRLEFVDEATLRQEYLPHSKRDLRDVLGFAASPKQLRLRAFEPQRGFIAPPSGTPVLAAQANWMTLAGISNPAPGGRGIYALVPDAALPFEFDFTLGEEGWRRQDAPRFFTTPNFIAGDGRLGLGSRGLNTFGAWLAPENVMAALPDRLLVARFTLSSNLSTPAQMPTVRLRLNAENLDSAALLQINSDAAGTAIPTTAQPVDYYLIYEPPRTAIAKDENADGVGVGFDLMHLDVFDDPSAQVFLENFSLQYQDKDTFDAGFTPVKQYRFEFNREGWVFSGSVGQLTPPTGGYSPALEALYLQPVDAQTFGFWTVDSGVVITTGTLYRVTFNVASTASGDAGGVPTFRLRVSDGISANVVQVVSSETGGLSPLTIDQPYEVYFRPPAGVAATGRTLILGWDIANFNPTDDPNIRLFLETVTIEQRPF